MKLLKMLLVVIAVSVMGNAAMAQDKEITDSDLRKYAIMTKAIDFMKKDISVELNKMIKAQEGMTGKRYKELAATKGDEAKLAAIEAKDYEKQFIGLVNKMMDDRKAAIKQVNTELATKMVGNKGKLYKKIKADLKTDEALKARFDVILAEVAG
ncbi:MAG: hypothetical protein ABFS32_07020 [Bacteroidota bacterium]